MAKRRTNQRRKPRRITQATLKRLRADVGPQIAEEISRKLQRQVRPDEIDDVLNDGLEEVWESRDELAGREEIEWQEFYHTACLDLARQWSRAPWNRERRHEFGASEAFLERFEAARPRGEGGASAGGAGLSRKQKKLLRQAISELPEHERVIAEADLADPTGKAPAAPLARKLGISRSTVTSRRHRYHERLRTILENAGFWDK